MYPSRVHAAVLVEFANLQKRGTLLAYPHAATRVASPQASTYKVARVAPSALRGGHLAVGWHRRRAVNLASRTTIAPAWAVCRLQRRAPRSDGGSVERVRRWRYWGTIELPGDDDAVDDTPCLAFPRSMGFPVVSSFAEGRYSSSKRSAASLEAQASGDCFPFLLPSRRRPLFCAGQRCRRAKRRRRNGYRFRGRPGRLSYVGLPER